MAQPELPVGASAAGAVARAEADRTACAPIDWRQLSHELRTPLNAILGHTELLLDGSSGPLTAQARACLGEVQAAGRQLLRQVQLLLAWSELGVSRPEPAGRRVDVIALVRAALVRAARAGAAPGGVQVPPRHRMLVRGERSRLQMLVAEILALHGARAPMPLVRVETCAGRRALRFTWSGSRPARRGALHVALIETMARQQGADVALHPDGLSLSWPPQQANPPDCVGFIGTPADRSGRGRAVAQD